MAKIKKRPTHNGFKYQSKYAVIVLCEDEKQQASVYKELHLQGFKCKVVSV